MRFQYVCLLVVAAVPVVHSYDTIAGYAPDTDVTEHSKIDLDVAAIDTALSSGFDFVTAREIYVNGENSLKSSGFRNLQGFSLKFNDDDTTPALTGEPTFDIYAAYWASGTYADDFITDALAGEGFFFGASEVAREEGALKGMQYLSVWMYVIHEMEDAVADCRIGDLGDNDDPGVHAWDEAWAFYAGSLEGEDGLGGSGKLLYALANKRCDNYETCNEAGTANANLEILSHIQKGQASLLSGECDAVEEEMHSIISLMTVPLVQGALRYAYKVSAFDETTDQSTIDKETAEGWVFSAAVLPLVASCDAQAATLIRSNQIITGTGQMADSFETVKEAYESVYKCLGISCTDIGALKEIEDAGLTIGAACTDRIMGYLPASDVKEHSEIDLDMALFAEELEEGDWPEAIEVYSKGMYSAKSDSLRNIQGFSTGTSNELPKMEGEPLFDLYAAYWDSPTYADDFVMAALEATGDFTDASDVQREEGALKGAQYQAVWMYVIHELEDAIGDCKVGDLAENDAGVHAWDEGWAFYAGSLADGTGSGQLLYTLADKRCANFNTCSDGTSGTSMVNLQLESLFQQGREALKYYNCGGAEIIKSSIRKHMTVPLIQGAMRYFYEADPNGGNKTPADKQLAEGWAFLASVLPQIDACDPSVAQILRDNMVITTDSPVSSGYAELKSQIESTYACLGINAFDVGGYVSGDVYKDGMEPIVDTPVEDSMLTYMLPSAALAELTTETLEEVTVTADLDCDDDAEGVDVAIVVVLCIVLALFGIALGVFLQRRRVTSESSGKFGAVATDVGDGSMNTV